ncbi:MAG: hypothetical protein KatS3mg053_2251 [Candidatus Roseilinea sp.]|nr:MAG: hypothetical protein KatS3mg053_2251 [Candidatus Roseilinea sp.]
MTGVWLISYIALWLLVIALSVIVLGLVRQLGLIQLRLGLDSDFLNTREGLALHTPAPDFSAMDLRQNRPISLQNLRGCTSILIFVSPRCEPCRTLMPDVVAFARDYRRDLNIVLISQSSAEEALEAFGTDDACIALVADPSGALSKQYEVYVTPFAYRLCKDGLVQRRGIVNDLAGLEALLEDASSPEPPLALSHHQRDVFDRAATDRTLPRGTNDGTR